MAKSRKPRKEQVQKKVKSIKIVDNDGTFKLYKVWSSKVTAKEAFIVTDNLNDLVEDYKDACNKYRLQPDMKRVLKLITVYQQDKKGTHGKANFFESNHN